MSTEPIVLSAMLWPQTATSRKPLRPESRDLEATPTHMARSRAPALVRRWARGSAASLRARQRICWSRFEVSSGILPRGCDPRTEPSNCTRARACTHRTREIFKTVRAARQDRQERRVQIRRPFMTPHACNVCMLFTSSLRCRVGPAPIMTCGTTDTLAIPNRNVLLCPSREYCTPALWALSAGS